MTEPLLASGLGALLLGDWHVHSVFSDDARSPMEANVRAAEARGLVRMRATDHVRVDTPWVPEFVAAVASARRSTGVELFSGVEAKILDARGTLDVPRDLRVGRGGVDGIVIADHQFPGVDGPWSPTSTRERLAAGLSVGDALDLLIGATVAAMHAAGGGAQLAHPFSILPKVGLDESQLSAEHLRAWAVGARETGTSIEVNEKWACPSPRSIGVALAEGATLVASTDSHHADDVGVYSRVRELLAQVPAATESQAPQTPQASSAPNAPQVG
ncbi:PHP domain-containing protein [Pseudoclavibacter helvolus]|uniref:PHP domain-containing protein n=1 Tax=Pseudoclavibacter helvolus TaxID=255205 RepID=UPI003C753A66